MRKLCIILVAGALFQGGCASQQHLCDREFASQETAIAPCPVIEEVAVLPSARPITRGLIFDRRPGWYTASDFVGRSEWPSTDGYYRAPELISYRERFHDRQGANINNNDYTYRYFDTYRVGAAVR